MVPSLSHNIKSQTHSRVSECDGHPSIQVEPSTVNRMVTASAGVQTDLPKVVHSSCRSICHSSEPQTSSVHVSSPRPKCLGHRCSEHKLDGPHCLCLPSNGSPSQGDPKNLATEWSLHPQVFKQIYQKWFTPHVDLFATHLNHKLPLYISPVPDPKAWDIDALNINWTNLTAYTYPPTALLHKVIQKIKQCHCLIIVMWVFHHTTKAPD